MYKIQDFKDTLLLIIRVTYNYILTLTVISNGKMYMCYINACTNVKRTIFCEHMKGL